MNSYSKTNEYLDRIKSFKDEYLLADYIQHEIPSDLLIDLTFKQKMTQANPLIPRALEILNGERSIQTEIDEIGLEAVIEDTEKLKRVPKEYKEQLFNIATSCEENGDYEKAQSIYKKIISMGQGQTYKFNARWGNLNDNKSTLYYKSKYSYYICRIKNGEELTPEDETDLDSLIKEDKDNILNLRTPGKLSDFDIFSTYFTEITMEQLKGEILPHIPTNQKRPQPNPNPSPNPPQDRHYIPELSPDKRISFILDNFNIAEGKVKIGNAQLLGYIVFEPANSNVSIVEKFYDVKGDTIVPSYGGATYILHKDVELDLKKLSISQLSEKNKADNTGLIDRVYHSSEKYYTHLLERFANVEEAGKENNQHTSSPSNTQKSNLQSQSPGITSEEEITTGSKDTKNPPIDEQPKENLSADELETVDLSTLLDFIKTSDTEYTKIQEKLNSTQSKINEISQQLEELRHRSAKRIDETLTDEIVSIIREELKIIQFYQNTLAELTSLESSLIKQETKNRELRNKLSSRYTSLLLKGDK